MDIETVKNYIKEETLLNNDLETDNPETTSDTNSESVEKNTENVEDLLLEEQKVENIEYVLPTPSDKQDDSNLIKILKPVLFVLCVGLCCLAIITKFAPTKTIENNPQPTTSPLIGNIDDLSTTINSATIDEIPSSLIITDVSSVVDNVLSSIVSISSLNVPHTADFDANDTAWDKDTEMTGNASGVIIGDNGEEVWILTNAHVISDAKSILVTFHDNTNVMAYVKGSFADNDVALISVKISDIKKETFETVSSIVIGDSDKTKMGQGIIVVGNALGYGQSVTTGVISAIDRDITIEGNYLINTLQIDAPINPGNSGGALINTKGELIGIPTAKSTATYTEGVGFAIPINDIKENITTLCTKPSRLYATDDNAITLGINITDTYLGVMISNITKDSIAQKSELQVGDIIQSVNGTTISTSETLVSSIRYFQKGETVTFKLQRPNGKEYQIIDVKVKL